VCPPISALTKKIALTPDKSNAEVMQWVPQNRGSLKGTLGGPFDPSPLQAPGNGPRGCQNRNEVTSIRKLILFVQCLTSAMLQQAPAGRKKSTAHFTAHPENRNPVSD